MTEQAKCVHYQQLKAVLERESAATKRHCVHCQRDIRQIGGCWIHADGHRRCDTIAEPSPAVPEANGDCPRCGDPDHFAWAFTECASQPAVQMHEVQFDILDTHNHYEACPSCGSAIGMGLVSNADRLAVRCTMCGFRGPGVENYHNSASDKAAFDAWNAQPAAERVIAEDFVRPKTLHTMRLYSGIEDEIGREERVYVASAIDPYIDTLIERLSRAEATIAELVKALDKVGVESARELTDFLDIQFVRGRSYANPVIQAVSIVINQQIKKAIARATGKGE